MQTLKTKGKTYNLDDSDFIADPSDWDKDFAEALAPALGIKGELTPAHWSVLHFIRATYLETGSVPVVHRACKANNLKIRDLESLFPAGYQRGACKLAGVSFLAGGVCVPAPGTLERSIRKEIPVAKRVYRVNVSGFLIDPNEWDEDYALCKSRELQMQPLTEKHWQVIRYLRAEFKNKGTVPTIYATCAAAEIDIDEFAELFPSGYHRGAVKIAGLSLAAEASVSAPVEA